MFLLVEEATLEDIERGVYFAEWGFDRRSMGSARFRVQGSVSGRRRCSLGTLGGGGGSIKEFDNVCMLGTRPRASMMTLLAA